MLANGVLMHLVLTEAQHILDLSLYWTHTDIQQKCLSLI